MSEDTFTISELCDAFEVTTRTLRFYESKELLSPARIGKKRIYSRKDRARLKLILRGKRFGFSLEEIRQLLELYHRGDQQLTQLERTYELATQHLKEMEEKRAELDLAIEELHQQMRWCEDRIATLKKGSAA